MTCPGFVAATWSFLTWIVWPLELNLQVWTSRRREPKSLTLWGAVSVRSFVLKLCWKFAPCHPLFKFFHYLVGKLFHMLSIYLALRNFQCVDGDGLTVDLQPEIVWKRWFSCSFSSCKLTFSCHATPTWIRTDWTYYAHDLADHHL